MTARERAEELRRLHDAPELLVLPNVWDAASARTVAARVGSWFMQTDVLGHWAAGFANHGKFISVAAPVGAHPNRPAPATKPAPTTTATPSPGGGGGGGGSNLALLALLAAVGLTVAALPTWRRRRDGGDSSASAPDDDSEPPSESDDETEDSEEREHDGAPV